MCASIIVCMVQTTANERAFGPMQIGRQNYATEATSSTTNTPKRHNVVAEALGMPMMLLIVINCMPCRLLCAKRYTKCVFQTCHDCMPNNTTMLSESLTTCSCCPTSLHTIDKRRAHCTRQTNNQVCGGYLGVLNIQPYAPP